MEDKRANGSGDKPPFLERHGTAAFAVVATLAVAALVIVPQVTEDSEPSGDPSPSISTVPPPPDAPVLGEAMCDKPAPQPDAKAYRGKGPHRFTAFDGDTTNLEFTELTPDWVTENAGEVELVVCFDARFVKVVNTCDLRNNDDEIVKVDVLAFDYHFRIFEATTGDLLDEQVERADDPTCPTSVLMEADKKQWTVDSPVDEDRVRDIVEPWVTDTVD